MRSRFASAVWGPVRRAQWARMTGVEVLNKRVLTSGIELGRVVDVILDESGERPIGYDVLCGDGSHRFLPYPTARIDGDHVEVDSPFVLLEAAQLDFYRERGRALRS
jgi:PRC-barrel domain protein